MGNDRHPAVAAVVQSPWPFIGGKTADADVQAFDSGLREGGDGVGRILQL